MNFWNGADKDYARFLHDDGYAADENRSDNRRFKLFCFSTIRAQKRRIARDKLILTGSQAHWLVCSPLEKFLQRIRVRSAGETEYSASGAKNLPQSMKTLPVPQFDSPQEFTCLTPIVSGVSAKHNGKPATKYLRPGDKEFPERLRANLFKIFRATDTRRKIPSSK